MESGLVITSSHCERWTIFKDFTYLIMCANLVTKSAWFSPFPLKMALQDICLALTIWGLDNKTYLMGIFRFFKKKMMAVPTISVNLEWHLSACLILLRRFVRPLFIYFWLRWVFVAARGLSLVAASGGYSSLRCAGFLLCWLLLLWRMGSRRVGFSSCGAQA